jgi:hypothetical protein
MNKLERCNLLITFVLLYVCSVVQATSQEISCLVWNVKDHYHILKGLTQDCTLCQVNSINDFMLLASDPI